MADLDFRVKNGLVVDNGGLSLSNTSTQITVGSTVVNSTFVSATNISGNGAALTTTNASNITSGTLANARLPATISVTTLVGGGAGITGVNADTLQGNTVTSLLTGSANAYTNAVTTASSDATTKAGTAYSNAVTYAATIAGTAYSNAATYAATIAGTAYSNAVTIATNASNITSGTLANARLPATISVTTLVGGGAGITGVNATQLNSRVEANFNVNSATYSTYLNSKTEGNLNVNNAITSNVATYINNGTANMSFAFSGQLGQPTWLWGQTTAAGPTVIYNPANFNVNNAITANNTTYVNTKTEANLNVNNAITANNTTYVNTKTEANLNVNSAITANNTTYVNTKTEANLNVNSAVRAITANNTTYVNTKTEGNLNVNNAVWSSYTYNVDNYGGYVQTGYIRCAGDIAAFFSDRRLKTNIKPITGALAKVSSLNGILYNPNDLGASFGYNTNEKIVGLFADEVEAIQPEAVKLAPFDNDNGASKSGENYKTVQYEKLVPLLVEAIKELKAELEELKRSKP